MFQRSPSDRRRSQRRGRKGATLVEAAISLGLMLSVLIFVLDYAVASFRSQTLNYLADRLAREAAIHGTRTSPTWRGGPWGPTAVQTTLAGTDAVAQMGRVFCNTLPNADVTIRITWPSGSNEMGNPVLVNVEMPWSPALFRPVSSSLITLRGVSRQTIAH